MARYWIENAATSAGIAALGVAAGYLLDAAAGHGTVPYLNNFVRNVSDVLAYGGPVLGAAVFAGRIPGVVDRERSLRHRRRLEDIEHIGMDAAETRAHRRVLRERQRYIRDLFR